jgi:hypothetical protein
MIRTNSQRSPGTGCHRLRRVPLSVKEGSIPSLRKRPEQGGLAFRDEREITTTSSAADELPTGA